MIFKIYSGDKDKSNESVNITCHGSFSANSIQEAIEIVEFSQKKQYLESWQINDNDRRKYKQKLVDAFQWNIFVCDGDFNGDNVIWKDKKAVINYFQKKA